MPGADNFTPGFALAGPGDHERMLTAKKVLLTAAVAGFVLSQQACDSAAAPVAALPSAGPATASATPVRSASPAAESSGSGSLSADGVLSGERKVVIKPVGSPESIVAVDDKGRLSSTDGEAPKGLFLLVPTEDAYMIKTAEVESTGNPSCMGVRNNGSDPLTVVASTCDAARDGQLFEIEEEEGGSGERTYSIRNGDAFLQITREFGLIAQELGDSPLETTFSFVDNGQA